MNIAVLGGGSWGTALALHLARKNYSVNVWEFFTEQASKMQNERTCPFLPGTLLPNNIFISSNMKEVLNGSELVLLVVPSDKVKSTMNQAKDFLTDQSIIICSKGFDNNLNLLSDIVKEQVNGEVYCLYGPTHAEEVSKDMFSGIVLAGGNGKEEIKEVFQSENFKVDLSNDLIGVQVSSSLKNILALLIGALDGAGLGDNAVAYVITKGLNEIAQVGIAFGAQKDTFYGLAGMGDVIVTCSSEHSRNRHVGKQIGSGRGLQEVLEEMKMIAEGVTIAESIPLIKEKFDLEIPLLTGTYEILFQGKKLEDLFKVL